MPFAVAAAGIGAAGSIATGIMGSNASSAAARAQENAANQASQLEQGMYNQTRQDLAPYMDAGTNALSAYQKMLGIGPGGTGATSPILQMLGIGPNGQPTGGGINPATFQSSPGYQFQLQQGMDAVTNSNAARGGLGGNALKALQQYGSGLANQSWNQYLQNANTGWNTLTSNVGGLANTGATVAQNLGRFSMGLGGALGENAMEVGNAQAGGIMGGYKALSGGIGQAIGDIGGLLAPGGGKQSPLSGLGTSIGNWWSGANSAAASQYANPYGATGFGMAPIVGTNGLMGGGV